MRVGAATKTAGVRQCELPGRQCRANFREMFSVSANGQVVRARPTAGSDRGFARSNLIRLGLDRRGLVGRCFIFFAWVGIGNKSDEEPYGLDQYLVNLQSLGSG